MGIKGNIHQLTKRKTEIRVNKNMSSNYNVYYGVLQRATLDPLQFLLFIIDLPNFIREAIIANFADETSVTNSAESLEESR